MGRIYRPVEIIFKKYKATTVAIIDTGSDESVISERIAKKIKTVPYGTFRAVCASDTILEGKYADVKIKELWSEKEIDMIVGVSNIPFNTDDIDEEGIEVILGIDFIQKAEIKIKI